MILFEGLFMNCSYLVQPLFRTEIDALRSTEATPKGSCDLHWFRGCPLTGSLPFALRWHWKWHPQGEMIFKRHANWRRTKWIHEKSVFFFLFFSAGLCTKRKLCGIFWIAEKSHSTTLIKWYSMIGEEWSGNTSAMLDLVLELTARPASFHFQSGFGLLKSAIFWVVKKTAHFYPLSHSCGKIVTFSRKQKPTQKKERQKGRAEAGEKQPFVSERLCPHSLWRRKKVEVCVEVPNWKVHTLKPSIIALEIGP